MRHFSKWTGVVLAALLWVGASAQAANEPWQGNPEYPFVVAHDNVVVYQDNASLKFLQFTPEGVMWRIDLVTVLPVTDPNSIARVDRIWYRKMNNEQLDRVYVKLKEDAPWGRLDLANTDAYNLLLREGFLASWDLVYGYPYPIPRAVLDNK